MNQEATTPQDGNIYARSTASLAWSVERWHADGSRYEAHYADTRQAGERLARDWATAASVKAFVLAPGGGVTPIEAP